MNTNQIKDFIWIKKFQTRRFIEGVKYIIRYWDEISWKAVQGEGWPAYSNNKSLTKS